MHTSTIEKAAPIVGVATDLSALDKANTRVSLNLAKQLYGGETAVARFCEANDFKVQGQYNTPALLQLLPFRKDELAVCIYAVMSFKDDRGIHHRIKRNTNCSMNVDLFDDTQAAAFNEVIAGRLAGIVNPVIANSTDISVMLGFQLFNESFDKFLTIPLVDVSILSATFSASELLA